MVEWEEKISPCIKADEAEAQRDDIEEEICRWANEYPAKEFTKVMKFLKIRDRVSVEKTCRRWRNLSLDTPLLCREFSLTFEGHDLLANVSYDGFTKRVPFPIDHSAFMVNFSFKLRSIQMDDEDEDDLNLPDFFESVVFFIFDFEIWKF